MKGPAERERTGMDIGGLGGFSVPGAIPGFFLSVPPWPAPTPMPMDQLPGWDYYSQYGGGYPMPLVSPYAAYPPQPVYPNPYQVMQGNNGAWWASQGTAQNQVTVQPGSMPGFPFQQEALGACERVPNGKKSEKL